MDFDKINLSKRETRSLRSFRSRPHQKMQEIDCFHALFIEYSFIKEDFDNRKDEFGCNIFLGTYSISEQYERYTVYLRRRRLESLPNWLAITISLISLIAKVLIELWLR